MSSWATAKLKDVAKIVTGKTPKTSNPDYYGNDIPFLSPADLNESVFEDAKIYLTHLGADQVYKVPKNTVLVSCIGNLGKLTIVDREVCFNQQINGLIFDEQKISPKYGFYYAQTLKPQLEKASSSTTLPIVNKSRFSELEIQYPPLEEQRRIADILDKADSLIQKRKASIAKLDELLQATFIDMFGDPTTYANRFTIKTLKESCNKITDGEHGTVERLESGKLYLMARNITQDMTLDMSELSYISADDHQRIYKRCNPEYGDIMLVCVGATIGKLCQVPKMEEFSLARSVALLKPNKNILNPNFLLHLLASHYMQEKIYNSRNTAAQSGLYLGKLNIISIPIPPKELQDKWAEFAAAVEEQKNKMQAQLEEQETLFKALQQQAFSGQL